MDSFLTQTASIWFCAICIGTLVLQIVITICMRAYYMKKIEECEADDDKNREYYGKAYAYMPEYYFNSVMGIIVTNTIIFGTMCIHDFITKVFHITNNDLSSLILLVMIIAAILVNNVLDDKWLNRRWLHDDSSEVYKKENLRLLSLLSTFMITAFVSLVFKIETNMSYALGLMILGRFICFDSTKKSFLDSIKGVFAAWKSLLLALILTLVMLCSGYYLGIFSTSTQLIWILALFHVVYLVSIELTLRMWKRLL